MSTTAVCLDARISTSAGRMPTATPVLPLTKEESSTDYHDHSEGVTEQRGEENVSADAVSMHGVGAVRGKAAAAASGEGEGGAAAAAAHAAAVAAAAEEVASAESHSLTQGAMKLVYLLAIQVK